MKEAAATGTEGARAPWVIFSCTRTLEYGGGTAFEARFSESSLPSTCTSIWLSGEVLPRAGFKQYLRPSFEVFYREAAENNLHARLEPHTDARCILLNHVKA